MFPQHILLTHLSWCKETRFCRRNGFILCQASSSRNYFMQMRLGSVTSWIRNEPAPPLPTGDVTRWEINCGIRWVAPAPLSGFQADTKMLPFTQLDTNHFTFFIALFHAVSEQLGGLKFPGSFWRPFQDLRSVMEANTTLSHTQWPWVQITSELT